RAGRQRGGRSVVAWTQQGEGRWVASRPPVRFLRCRPTVKILGISGFERAIPFKRAHWPGLDEREYRISQGHDSAAVLLVDGRIVAAESWRNRSEEHTSELQSRRDLVCRLLLEK